MIKVLIVDDSLIIRNILKNILTKLKYKVVGEAKDGREAVYLYPRLLPDLVTLDISMPDMGGLNALRKIMDFDKNATVVMVTAQGQEIDVIKSIKLGAKGYILKPIDEEKITETVTRLFPDDN